MIDSFQNGYEMNKIAILCPVHRRPDLLKKQLENYNHFFKNGCIHILHPSKEGATNFDECFFQELELNHNAFKTRQSNGTSWKSIIGALIACTDELDLDQCDFVYIHTDGDLLVKGNLSEYIYKNKLGFWGEYPKESFGWPHQNMMESDQRFARMRHDLGLSFEDILMGRQEGSFYPIDIWKKIISKISEYYNEAFFDSFNIHWPVEEVVIPTLANFYTNGQSRVPNIIKTKELILPGGRDNRENCISVDELQVILDDKNKQCVGVKWFSQDADDPARIMVEKLYN